MDLKTTGAWIAAVTVPIGGSYTAFNVVQDALVQDVENRLSRAISQIEAQHQEDMLEVTERLDCWNIANGELQEYLHCRDDKGRKRILRRIKDTKEIL